MKITVIAAICAVASAQAAEKGVSVRDAIAKARVVQGKYPYTEVNDREMNGIIAADRAIDAAWVEAAKDPAAHARFVGEGRFAGMKMVKPTWSWKQMIDDENLYTRFADIVHGAYRHYDWTDLMSAAPGS